MSRMSMVGMVCRNIWGIIWSRQDCNQSSVIRVMSALRPVQAEPKALELLLGQNQKYKKILENTKKDARKTTENTFSLPIGCCPDHFDPTGLMLQHIVCLV